MGMALSVAGLVLVLIVILTFAPVLVWADRRQSAMIQDRIGPNRAGIHIGGKNFPLWGLLHPLADALKFMWKEDFIPPRADKLLFALAPILSVIPAIASFTVIPWSAPRWPATAATTSTRCSVVCAPPARWSATRSRSGCRWSAAS